MNRTALLICILSGLVLGYYIIVKSKDTKMDVLTEERAFAVKDVKDIHRIVITQRNKPSIKLEREDKVWKLNDKYLARENAVDNLLEVLSTVNIKFMPEATAKQNILKEMRTIGVQVDIFNDDTELIKSYTIGGSTQDERGSYFLMSGYAQPFVMHIPSIEGSLRGRFIYSESDWRDRALLRENADKITSVRMVYRDTPEESFEIEKLNKVLLLKGLKTDNLSQSKLKSYISDFEEVYAEFIDNENPLRDSISQLQPFCTLSIGDSQNSTKSIKFYPLTELIYEGEPLSKEELVTVDGRYFADCSWGDFMLVQQRLIGKLLVGKSHFQQ